MHLVVVKTLALHYKDRIGLVAHFGGLFDKGNDSWDLWEHTCLIVGGEILECGLWSCGV